MAIEVRKTGGGEFYLVSRDGDEIKDIHKDSKLLKFKTSKEAKDACDERHGKGAIRQNTISGRETMTLTQKDVEVIEWH